MRRTAAARSFARMAASSNCAVELDSTRSFSSVQRWKPYSRAMTSWASLSRNLAARSVASSSARNSDADGGCVRELQARRSAIDREVRARGALEYRDGAGQADPVKL